MTHHLVEAITAEGAHVFRVHADGTLPSWSECASQIPGYVTGKRLGQCGTDVRRPCKRCQEGANR